MRVICLLALLWAGTARAEEAIAPTGVLRAVFLASNPAHAARDPATGALVGPAAALTQGLAGELALPFALRGVADPGQVAGAVAAGDADIGFLAYAPSRVGTVVFSQTYALVQQGFIVRDGAPMQDVGDVDRAGNVVAGTTDDSITLYMRRVFRSATVMAVENDPAANQRRLLAGAFDAFGGNRHRLAGWERDVPGTRVLAGSLFDVPQAIVVRSPAVLAVVDGFIDRARAAGMIGQAIAAAGLIGVSVAPAGYRPQLAQ